MSSTPNCEKTSRGGADESNSGISTSAEKGRPEQASQPITLPEVRKQHGHQIEDRIFEQAIDDLNWLAVIEFIEEAIEVPDRRSVRDYFLSGVGRVGRVGSAPTGC